MGTVLAHTEPGTEVQSPARALPGDGSVTVFQSSSLVSNTTVIVFYIYVHRPFISQDPRVFLRL